MFDKDAGPKDWEIRDEEPPESLKRKWDREEASGSPSVTCPFCKKENSFENVACIFCGRLLPKFSPAPKTPWYAKTSLLVIGLLTVGPFALPLVWCNPVYSRRKKVLVTVFVLILTFALVVMFLRGAGAIYDYYKQADLF